MSVWSLSALFFYKHIFELSHCSKRHSFARGIIAAFYTLIGAGDELHHAAGHEVRLLGRAIIDAAIYTRNKLTFDLSLKKVSNYPRKSTASAC